MKEPVEPLELAYRAVLLVFQDFFRAVMAILPLPHLRHGDGMTDAVEGVLMAIDAMGGNGEVAFVGWDVEPMGSREADLV